MAKANSLIQIEATRDYFKFLLQAVKAPNNICFDCVVAAGDRAAKNKSILKSKYFLPNTSSSSKSVPKFHVLWMPAPSYQLSLSAKVRKSEWNKERISERKHSTLVNISVSFDRHEQRVLDTESLHSIIRSPSGKILVVGFLTQLRRTAFSVPR